MGLFNSIRTATAIGVATARGNRVADEIQTLMNNINAGSESMRMAIFEAFLNRRKQLIVQRSKWTPEQQRSIGKSLTDQGNALNRRAKSNADEVESYSIYLCWSLARKWRSRI